MTITMKTPDPVANPEVSLETVLTFVFVPDKLKLLDAELFQTKWFDYRFMSPFEATMTYIDAFGAEARQIYSRDIDYERAKHIRIVNPGQMQQRLIENDQQAKRAFSGFWRGRQVADAIGMPYPVYIHEALSSRMRHWQRTYLPNASQLYNESDVERVAKRWDDLKASRIYYADHHAFLAQNYQAEPAQVAYCDYLFERARGSSDFIATLRDMIEGDHMSVTYLETKDRGICEQACASLM